MLWLPCLQLDRLGVVRVEGLGVALEAGGIKDEGGDKVGVDVGRRAAILQVALVVAARGEGGRGTRVSVSRRRGSKEMRGRKTHTHTHTHTHTERERERERER